MTTTNITTPRPREFSDDKYAVGPNARDVQEKVPFAMTSPTYYVPKERYYDREFYELEKEHLWRHAWQMAARTEEIPNPGDFVEYVIVGNSILIIRQQDGSVKALHNACRHRATELAKDRGRFPGGQIVCPFHGWRWNLDGSNSFVFMDGFFEPSCVKREDVALRECQVEVWGNMVWINLDRNAPPLNEALSPVKEILESCGVQHAHVKWWKQVILDGNWKVTIEAFLESYHNKQTHPQLLMGGDNEWAEEFQERAIEYTSFRGGHGRFQASSWKGPDWTGEEFIESQRLLAEGMDAMVVDRDIQVLEGLRNRIGIDNPEFGAEATRALYDYAADASIPMSPLSDRKGMSVGGEIYIFPNYFMLPMWGNCLAYRMRPYNDDPERVVFDIWSLIPYPAGQEPERAELAGVFDKDDVEHWPTIPRQDFANIEKQQRGLHSQSFECMRLTPILETNIVNLHEELDRVIAAGMQ